MAPLPIARCNRPVSGLFDQISAGGGRDARRSGKERSLFAKEGAGFSVRASEAGDPGRDAWREV